MSGMAICFASLAGPSMINRRSSLEEQVVGVEATVTVPRQVGRGCAGSVKQAAPALTKTRRWQICRKLDNLRRYWKRL